MISLRRDGARLVVALLALGVAGCAAEPKGEVQGRVLFQGQPVLAGTVRFRGADGKESSAVIRDGAYRIDNVSVGKAEIAVIAPKIPAGLLGSDAKKSPAIPVRYARPETSGLEHTVRAGSQTCDLRLDP